MLIFFPQKKCNVSTMIHDIGKGPVILLVVTKHMYVEDAKAKQDSYSYLAITYLLLLVVLGSVFPG